MVMIMNKAQCKRCKEWKTMDELEIIVCNDENQCNPFSGMTIICNECVTEEDFDEYGEGSE